MPLPSGAQPRLLRRGRQPGNRAEAAAPATPLSAAASNAPTIVLVPPTHAQAVPSRPPPPPQLQPVFRIPQQSHHHLPSPSPPLVLVMEQADRAQPQPAPESLAEQLLDLVFRCRQCGITFQSRESFQSHVRSVHQSPGRHPPPLSPPPPKRPAILRTPSPQPQQQQQRMFVCVHCSRPFSGRDACRRHMEQEHPRQGASREEQQLLQQSERRPVAKDGGEKLFRHGERVREKENTAPLSCTHR